MFIFINAFSSSIPAPLFYNDDDTPDMFLRVNIGEWDDYDYSYVVIIDGTDGKALWAMNSSYATMQSAVTLTSVDHSQDAVVFFAYNPIETRDLNSVTVKKRQMDGDQGSTSSPNVNVPPNGPSEVNFHDNVKHLNEQFWNLSNASFPDPLVDPKGFIESCKFDSDQSPVEHQCYLYFITRDLVTTSSDGIDPIAVAFPGILSEALIICMFSIIVTF